MVRRKHCVRSGNTAKKKAPTVARRRLFQPFTSYGKQNGIGLGLTISQKIMQDHGGAIALESSGTGRVADRLGSACSSLGDG